MYYQLVERLIIKSEVIYVLKKNDVLHKTKYIEVYKQINTLRITINKQKFFPQQQLCYQRTPLIEKTRERKFFFTPNLIELYIIIVFLY